MDANPSPFASFASTGDRRLAHVPTLPEVDDLPHFAALLNRQLGQSRRSRSRLALILIEVDADAGWTAAERAQLLLAVGTRLRARVRDSDLVCRVGEMRFGLVLTDAGRSEAEVVRTRLRKQLWGSYSIEDRHHCLTMQMGVAVHRECGMTGAELTAAATRCLGSRAGSEAAALADPRLSELVEQPRPAS